MIGAFAHTHPRNLWPWPGWGRWRTEKCTSRHHNDRTVTGRTGPVRQADFRSAVYLLRYTYGHQGPGGPGGARRPDFELRGESDSGGSPTPPPGLLCTCILYNYTQGPAILSLGCKLLIILVNSWPDYCASGLCLRGCQPSAISLFGETSKAPTRPKTTTRITITSHAWPLPPTHHSNRHHLMRYSISVSLSRSVFCPGSRSSVACC